MRYRSHPILAGILIALTLGSCAKEATRPEGEPADMPGTPLSGPDAVEGDAALLWSKATNEVISQRPISLGGAGGPIAIDALSGATRTLDTLDAFLISGLAALCGGDSLLFYNAFDSGDFSEPDSIQLREIHLVGSADASVLAACPVLCLYFVASAPTGPYLAFGAVDLSGMDSLTILDLSAGTRVTTDPGSPLAFSPDGKKLLFEYVAFPLVADRRAMARALRRSSQREVFIYSLADGTVVPFSLGIPDVVSGDAVRWDGAGIQVLYVDGAKSLYHRNSTTGVTRFLWQAPDTIDGTRLAWSADGAKAALWNYGPSSSGNTRYSLYVIDLVTANAARVAHALAKGGGIAFSPDRSKVAYVYGARVYTSLVPPVTTRSPALGAAAGPR